MTNEQDPNIKSLSAVINSQANRIIAQEESIRAMLHVIERLEGENAKLKEVVNYLQEKKE
jgi:uncharacterized protein (UPF0335 family)